MTLNIVNNGVMKKLIMTLLLATVNMTCFCQLGYRYGDSFIKLTPDTLCFFVQTKTKERMNFLKNNSSEKQRKGNFIAELSENACIMDSKPTEGDDYVSEIFKDEKKRKIIILPRLAIKMKKGYDVGEIIKAYDGILQYDKEENYVKKFNCNLRTATEVLKLNSRINEMDCVEWSEPMMIGEAVSYNTLYSSQYYLHNIGQMGGTTGIDINVEPAWDVISADTTLIVAVLDDGVERNHEDLYGSVLDGMTIDYPYEKGDPINEYYDYTYYDIQSHSYEIETNTKAHGTACAGIIAAHNNNIGIRGVASGIKILPININPHNYPLALLQYPTVWYEKIGQAIYWAYNTKKADIINCSWGFSENIYISNALNDAMIYGRDGKGTIVVCASGNDESNNSVKFPANITGTIAVGAINNTGNIWDYSCRGNSLDLVAPSGLCNLQGDVVTTDRAGNLGYNPYGVTPGAELSDMNYTQRFGGTSAACPQVAGVTALILSLRPDLTECEVRNILYSTARDLGDTGWDSTYGYGLVDAYAAVRVAQNWQDCSHCTLSGTNRLCQHSYATYSISGVPSGATVSWSFTKTYGTNSPLMSVSSSGLSCTLLHNTSTMFEGTLKAEVKILGYTLATYTKQITGDVAVLDGPSFYWDGLPYEDMYENMLTEDDNFATYPNVVLVRSPNIYGKNIHLYRSSSPYSLYSPMTRGNDYFSFEMPDLSSGETLNILISGGCTQESFAFYKSHLNCLNSGKTIQVSSQTDNRYLITFNPEYEKFLNKKSGGINESSKDMIIHIYSAEDTRLVLSEECKDYNYTFDATSWKPGIYIVRAVFGGKVYSTKFNVK